MNNNTIQSISVFFLKQTGRLSKFCISNTSVGAYCIAPSNLKLWEIGLEHQTGSLFNTFCKTKLQFFQKNF